MNIHEMLKLTPESLAKAQYDELKKHALQVLSEVSSLIYEDKFGSLDKFTFFSPSGDGYGLDNNCINFGTDDEVKDIADVVNRLVELRGMMK